MLKLYVESIVGYIANINSIIKFELSFCVKSCTYGMKNVNLNTEMHGEIRTLHWWAIALM